MAESSVVVKRRHLEFLRSHPDQSELFGLPPAAAREDNRLRVLSLEADLARDELHNSLLSRPLSDRDRDQIIEALEQELRDSGEQSSSWMGESSDWALRQGLDAYIEAMQADEFGVAVELDWSEEGGDPYEIARHFSCGTIRLTDHGPGGGNPVHLFWGLLENIRDLLQDYGADPMLTYEAGQPACRICGWSQYGSVFDRTTCPRCGEEFDWN